MKHKYKDGCPECHGVISENVTEMLEYPPVACRKEIVCSNCGIIDVWYYGSYESDGDTCLITEEMFDLSYCNEELRYDDGNGHRCNRTCRHHKKHIKKLIFKCKQCEKEFKETEENIMNDKFMSMRFCSKVCYTDYLIEKWFVL